MQEMSPFDLLYLMAEISIATMAFSGITMVLAVSSVSLNAKHAGQIGLQLRMAFIVTAFSILPLLLSHYRLDEEELWRIASFAYVLAVLANLLYMAFNESSRALLPNKTGLLAQFTGVSAIVLLFLNLWLATSWPYLTQLFIAWCTSTMLFLAFIHEVLMDKRVNEAAS